MAELICFLSKTVVTQLLSCIFLFSSAYFLIAICIKQQKSVRGQKSTSSVRPAKISLKQSSGDIKTAPTQQSSDQQIQSKAVSNSSGNPISSEKLGQDERQQQEVKTETLTPAEPRNVEEDRKRSKFAFFHFLFKRRDDKQARIDRMDREKLKAQQRKKEAQKIQKIIDDMKTCNDTDPTKGADATQLGTTHTQPTCLASNTAITGTIITQSNASGRNVKSAV